MSRKALITGDTVVFKNPYTSQDITLKHDGSGFKLVFDSEVEFKYSTSHVEVTLGGFKIKQTGDNLVFSKGDKTLMLLSE